MNDLAPDIAAAFKLHEAGQFEAAEAAYLAVLDARPDDRDALQLAGILAFHSGRHDEAERRLGRAHQLSPTDPEPCYNLAVLLAAGERWEEAAEWYERSLALDPQQTKVLYNLAMTRLKLRDEAAASALFERVLDLDPTFAGALNNLGMLKQELAEYDEAARLYDQALHYQPDMAEGHLNRALLNLLRGDLQQGWPEYEWRWQTGRQKADNRQFTAPRWDGRPLDGQAILLHTEQGLGDSLQFIRYARLVQQRGGHTIVEVPIELKTLFERSPGIDQLLQRGVAVPTYAAHAGLASLPGIFATTLATIPAGEPYLTADPRRVAHWRSLLQPARELKVGLVWQGDFGHPRDRYRSLPLARFAPIWSVPGVRCYSLQKGLGRAQLANLPRRAVIDLADQLHTLDDTAAALHALDLLVTIDSSPAHLAGALGRPCWVLLPKVPDFRWLLDRDDSPWYPSLRLFRQSHLNVWDDAIAAVAGALSALVGTRKPTS